MPRQPLKTYLRLCTEFYDLDKPMLSGGPEYDFYMAYARQAHGPILEPMCGTGRFLIPMLQARLPIEGFDASPHMLHTLKQKYAALSDKSPPVTQQFVQDFKSPKRFGLIFVPFGSWGLVIDRAEAIAALAVMFEHLAPGGTLLLEIETVFSVPEPCGVWRRGVHLRSDGSKVAINARIAYDVQTQLFTSMCQYESLVNGRVVETEAEDFSQYLYRFDELDPILRDIGFSGIKKYQDYHKTPAVDAKAPIVVYECIK
jgi:hypothetical protein